MSCVLLVCINIKYLKNHCEYKSSRYIRQLLMQIFIIPLHPPLKNLLNTVYLCTMCHCFQFVKNAISFQFSFGQCQAT